MALTRSGYRGCLLGMAVGDAMGYTVDNRNWQEIREDYGPNGLLGYDLVNGYADVTSYTQLAAFTANGLLFGLTRGQLTGEMAPFIQYIHRSSKAWAASQSTQAHPGKNFCWLSRRESICRRNCMDTQMRETLLREREPAGSLALPVNKLNGPEGLTAAIGVGLFYHRYRMRQAEVDRLGAEAVALTHGSPTAVLTGAAVAHIISRLVADPSLPLRKVFLGTSLAIVEYFGHEYSQASDLATLIRHAVTFADFPEKAPVDIMENKLHCDNAAKVLAGAIYACLVSKEDFDRALIIAVNHSGRSAAVGAIVGAILGLRAGEEALPKFYIDCLEPVDVLRELADDLYTGCPMEKGSKFFDLDWDYKYRTGGH